jgi:hypothetical protein
MERELTKQEQFERDMRLLAKAQEQFRREKEQKKQERLKNIFEKMEKLGIRRMPPPEHIRALPEPTPEPVPEPARKKTPRLSQRRITYEYLQNFKLENPDELPIELTQKLGKTLEQYGKKAKIKGYDKLKKEQLIRQLMDVPNIEEIIYGDDE